MKTVKVEGSNKKHKVLLYALSTCAWCKLTKKFLNDNNIAYDYIDVDLCSDEDRETIREDMRRRGGSVNYPTVIVDEKTVITGFLKNKLQEALID